MTDQMWRSSSQVAETDGDAQLQVGAQPELVDGVFEVRLQFGLAGVGAGPVVRLERVAVEIGMHVDFGPGIRIVPPRPADPSRGLVDREGLDTGPPQFHPRRNASDPGTDHDDSRGAGGAEQLRGGRPQERPPPFLAVAATRLPVHPDPRSGIPTAPLRASRTVSIP